MRLGLFGKGRMGMAILAEIEKAKGIELAWVEDLEPVERIGADVAVDFSIAAAVPGHIDWAVANGVDLVVATTGWSLPDLERRVGGKIGLLVAPNLSPGAALVRRMAAMMGAFAGAVPDADVAICEWHHKLKADAPSGTAKSFAEAVISAGPRYSGWNMGNFETGKVNVSSIRTGYDAGRHEIILDQPFETISITHRARDRRVFAAGALTAAAWLRGKKGLFTMDDFAAAILGGSNGN